jgi:hypothetical protein
MKQFRLQKISSNASIVKFDVLDGTGICGRISVKPEDEAALLACWKDTAPPAASNAAARGKRNSMVGAMMSARKHPQTRAAVLRGCC